MRRITESFRCAGMVVFVIVEEVLAEKILHLKINLIARRLDILTYQAMKLMKSFYKRWIPSAIFVFDLNVVACEPGLGCQGIRDQHRSNCAQVSIDTHSAISYYHPRLF